MHKRAFQALKRTFMQASGLHPPYFDNKTQYFILIRKNQILHKLVLISESGGGSPETCINVRFRP